MTHTCTQTYYGGEECFICGDGPDDGEHGDWWDKKSPPHTCTDGGAGECTGCGGYMDTAQDTTLRLWCPGCERTTAHRLTLPPLYGRQTTTLSSLSPLWWWCTVCQIPNHRKEA